MREKTASHEPPSSGTPPPKTSLLMHQPCFIQSDLAPADETRGLQDLLDEAAIRVERLEILARLTWAALWDEAEEVRAALELMIEQANFVGTLLSEIEAAWDQPSPEGT